LSHSNSPVFVSDVFEIGSQEVFVWAGFQQQSYWFLPPGQLGLRCERPTPSLCSFC
jgi:hypothetical protein